MGEVFEELILPTEKTRGTFQFEKFSITASNQELGSRFHLFAGRTSIDASLKLLYYLICAFSLEF